MSDARDDNVQHQLLALPGRPATERAEFLIEFGWSRAGQPTPGLAQYLTDPDLMVRIAAAHACWQTQPETEALDNLVAILAEGLDGHDEELALMAGTVLGNMGEVAVPALVRRFDERANPLIVRVVGEICGDEALRFLARAAQSPEPDIAEEAREALEAMAEEDRE